MLELQKTQEILPVLSKQVARQTLYVALPNVGIASSSLSM